MAGTTSISKSGNGTCIIRTTMVSPRGPPPPSLEVLDSEPIWKKIGSPTLSPTKNLVAYSNVPIRTMGETTVLVHAFGRSIRLKLCVVDTNDSALFGFDWSMAFELPLPAGARICNIKPFRHPISEKEEKDLLKQTLDKHRNVFKDGVGTIRNHKVKIRLSEEATPKVFAARRVPIAIKKSVETELDRLVTEGIIEPVNLETDPIEWASPIVVVIKPTGKVRICADFKVTINPFIQPTLHPLPNFEELLAKVGHGELFSVLDLKDAYLQLEVEENSKRYLNIATHKGIFRYRRMPFGVSLAPSVFQNIMDKVLDGIEGVACYLDDVMVTGRSLEEHLDTLNTVLKRLEAEGIRVNPQKCKWLQRSVEYLGHIVDREGIHPTKAHVEAIRDMPAPKNLKELRSFIGTVNYYSRFVPQFQSICAPLHRLNRKGSHWQWTQEHENTFSEIKNILSSDNTLVHYDPEKPLVLAADASETGVGAVLLHRYPNNDEKPIAYASRIYTASERNYASIDREALAIVFGIQKFSSYLLGKKFVLKSDHKPLIYLFGEDKQLPKVAANRLSRWAMFLSSFNYSMEFINGKDNVLADTLSRLPLSKEPKRSEEEIQGEARRNQLLHLRTEGIPVSKKALKEETTRDKILERIQRFVRDGWPAKKDLQEEFWPYFEKREELSIEEGCILWNGRIVMPSKLQDQMLNALHEGHPGEAAMKSIATLQVWWPKINQKIESFVKNCEGCQKTRPTGPAESPVYFWNTPLEKWSRLHVDYAGPFEGKYWFILMDATSKWLEVIPVNHPSTAKTISVMREIFTRFGVPKSIVSDNGPQFTSHEFEKFCRNNNILHIKSTPYHPRTNGLAERAVRTFKERMKASRNDRGDVELKVQKFLISYRNAIHSTTGRSPASMLLGRQIRTRLDLLRPDVTANIESAQHRQSQIQHRPVRDFEEGERVWVKTDRDKEPVAGQISERRGLLSYLVEINGKMERRHADQLRKRKGGDIWASLRFLRAAAPSAARIHPGSFYQITVIAPPDSQFREAPPALGFRFSLGPRSGIRAIDTAAFHLSLDVERAL
ncbi:unnamed protein product [Nesidiocoris tenuis]|uniref:RNA-directed DNA polymerase n=1 Tax=Nesidiocoris tenuis TaxID=355587 RepID=A0A6H5HK80_9HEMI|nr:unnamed protein product [Nesidiocoris tenuis]